MVMCSLLPPASLSLSPAPRKIYSSPPLHSSPSTYQQSPSAPVCLAGALASALLCFIPPLAFLWVLCRQVTKSAFFLLPVCQNVPAISAVLLPSFYALEPDHDLFHFLISNLISLCLSSYCSKSLVFCFCLWRSLSSSLFHVLASV